MKVRDKELYAELDKQLLQFSKEKLPLPGVDSSISRDVFVKQLIDSIRRVKYVFTVCVRDISNKRADPTSDYFDPLRASVLFQQQAMTDEAFWLVFLATHFGKALRSGWRLTRDIYGGLGSKDHWTWERTSANPEEFKRWLADNYKILKSDGIPRRFSNHRKYETLNPDSANNTGAIIESYVKWISPPKTHELLIQEAKHEVGNEPRAIFDYLYKSMNKVLRFGRTARFDYLTMVAKVGLAGIEPGSTYMQGSTGPASGARLLFGGNISCSALEKKLCRLEADLSLGRMGMQVLEDALCNWQKNPNEYKLFLG